MAKTKEVFFRTPYNYDKDDVSRETALNTWIDPETGEELTSQTQQHHKEECDINEIVRRFGLTGEMPENFKMPSAGDFTGISDFKTMADMVAATRDEFMTLPANIRERFYNDPEKLIGFLDDDKNRDEALRLGLIPAPVEKPRDVVQAVDELAAKIVPASK